MEVKLKQNVLIYLKPFVYQYSHLHLYIIFIELWLLVYTHTQDFSISTEYLERI